MRPPTQRQRKNATDAKTQKRENHTDKTAKNPLKKTAKRRKKIKNTKFQDIIMKACFMGLGYIGLPTAIIAAKHGVQVTGVDINPKVVELTNQGKLHIIEPGMEEMLQEVVKNGTLHASTKPETSDAYFMVVPTPFKGNHEPDISYVEAATRAVLPFLKEGDLYVIESTSPVGTTDKMRDLIFAERP